MPSSTIINDNSSSIQSSSGSRSRNETSSSSHNNDESAAATIDTETNTNAVSAIASSSAVSDTTTGTSNHDNNSNNTKEGGGSRPILTQQQQQQQENMNNINTLNRLFAKYDSFGVDDNVVNDLNTDSDTALYANGEDVDFPLFFWDMDDNGGSSTGGRGTPAIGNTTTATTTTTAMGSNHNSSANNSGHGLDDSSRKPSATANVHNSQHHQSTASSTSLPQSHTHLSAQNFVNELANQLASAAATAAATNPSVNINSASSLYNFGNIPFHYDTTTTSSSNASATQPGSGGLLQQHQGHAFQSTAAQWNNSSNTRPTSATAIQQQQQQQTLQQQQQQYPYGNQISILPKLLSLQQMNSTSSNTSTSDPSSSVAQTNNNDNSNTATQQNQQNQQQHIHQLINSLHPHLVNPDLAQDQFQKLQLLQQQLYNQGNYMLPPQHLQQQQQQQYQLQMGSTSQHQHNHQQRSSPLVSQDQSDSNNNNNDNKINSSNDNNLYQSRSNPNQLDPTIADQHLQKSTIGVKQQTKQTQKGLNNGRNKVSKSNNNNTSSKKRLLDNDDHSSRQPMTTTMNMNTKTKTPVVSSSDTDGEHHISHRTTRTGTALSTGNKKQRTNNNGSSAVSGATGNKNSLTNKNSSISSISSNSRHSHAKVESGKEEFDIDDNLFDSLSYSDDIVKTEDQMTEEEKAQANRVRNREHARNTRARKKAYLESLKSTLDELCRERDTLVSERANAASHLLEMQKTRTDVLLSFFALRSTYEERRSIWSSILDESFMCLMPVTPYRSFPASEVQISKCQRNILGIDGMTSDTASLHVLLNSLVDRSKYPNGTVEFRYTLIAEEAVVSSNQMMARWSMSTMNAVSLGAKREIGKSGMLCARFNSAHKIVALELMFDVMAFMLQLKQSSGASTFAMVPNTVQTCTAPFEKVPMVMTLAERPYTITRVNPAWEEMTMWKAEEVVDKMSCKILQGEKTEARSIQKVLNHVQYQRPTSTVFINYDRQGRMFRNFINLYPLSTDSKITHYVGLTVYYEYIEDGKPEE